MDWCFLSKSVLLSLILVPLDNGTDSGRRTIVAAAQLVEYFDRHTY